MSGSPSPNRKGVIRWNRQQPPRDRFQVILPEGTEEYPYADSTMPLEGLGALLALAIAEAARQDQTGYLRIVRLLDDHEGNCVGSDEPALVGLTRGTEGNLLIQPPRPKDTPGDENIAETADPEGIVDAVATTVRALRTHGYR